jgi:hypothetical protein
MVNPITTPSKSSSARPLALTAGTLALIFGGVALSPAATAAPENAPADTGWAASAYRGSVEVVEGPDADQETIDGSVFDDQNKNSVQDNGERGLGGVTVSNGRDVVTTDSQGRYELPAFENMTVFATQPRGYQVPVDENNVAQFYYHHLPEGSPELEHGGIAPTGPLPDAVNFPLAKSSLTQSPEQHCLIGGDIQTYTE